MILDYLDNSDVRSLRLNDQIYDNAARLRYYRYMFFHSPILCRSLIRDREIYGQSIVEDGTKYCGERTRR